MKRTLYFALLALVAAVLACNLPAGPRAANAAVESASPTQTAPSPSATATARPTLTPTSPPALTPTIPPENSRLAYSEGNSPCLMKPDGSERQCFPPPDDLQLRGTPGHLAWSPAGTHLAYFQGVRELLLLDLRSGQTTLRYRTEGEIGNYEQLGSGPAWDATGEHLAVTVENRLHVFPLEAETEATEVATDVWGESRNYSPYSLAWTADGTHILYLSGGKEYGELAGLAISDLNHPQSEHLLVPGAIQFALSPDRSQILYSLEGGGVYLVDGRCVDAASGLDCVADARLLAETDAALSGGFTLWHFRWSPDGRFILAASQPMIGRIYLLDAATGEFLPLPDEIANGGYTYFRSPSPWSPDSQQIVLTYARDGGITPSHLTIYDLESRQWYDITDFENESTYRQASWGFLAP